MIAIKIFNDENSPFTNMYEFKKEKVNEYAIGLKDFDLTNDDEDQKLHIIKKDTFSGLINLRSLKISLGYNHIIQFEKEILKEMPSNLDHLDLSYNIIKDINSISFGELKNLRRLVLRHNNINITFSNNHIFNGLNNLQVLELKNNTIPIIFPEMFKDLINLRYLDLSECDIEEIKDCSFSKLTFLKYLNLSDNLFKEITIKTFEGLGNLWELYLCNNYLNKIEDYSFSMFNNLKILDLTNQNIIQLKHFYDEYKRGDIKRLNRLGLKNNGVLKANF